jgi:hypothetical protein
LPPTSTTHKSISLSNQLSRIRPAREEPEQPKPRRANFKLGDLTVPETPKFATEHRLKRKILQTSEEMQMRAIQDKLENEHKKRKFQDKLKLKVTCCFTSNVTIRL